MSKSIDEILITLFKNTEGYTLSVLANKSKGGKRINYSFKGNQTKTLSIFSTGKNRMDVELWEYFQVAKNNYKDFYNEAKQIGLEPRISKGYFSGQTKGQTVPSAAGLIQHSNNQFFVRLYLGKIMYEAQLDPDSLSDGQIKQGAVAQHARAKASEVSAYDESFF
jgi:hypothetical protein